MIFNEKPSNMNFFRSFLPMLLVVASPLLAQAQNEPEENPKKLRSWTLGVRGLFLYDLPSTLYDSELSEDPQGLMGDNTSADFGFEVYLEKQFTPFFGLQGTFRYAGLTGATSTEYYENSFFEGRLGAIFIWSNLDPNHVQSRWNFYNNAGISHGMYEADRFLESDDSPNGSLDDSYYGAYLGGGIQYELAPSWRLEMEINYNVVRDDGFDGFDYASGWDPYLSAALGLAYTFGPREKPAMYASNYFEAPYYDLATQKAQMEALEKQMAEVEQVQDKQQEELKSGLEASAENNRRQDAALAALQEQVKSFEAKMQARKTEAYQGVVFFEFDSDELSDIAKERLVAQLQNSSGPYTLVGYADSVGPESYNEGLKKRRAEAVKRFLVDQMKVDAASISIETGDMAETPYDEFLKRRVEIR